MTNYFTDAIAIDYDSLNWIDCRNNNQHEFYRSWSMQNVYAYLEFIESESDFPSYNYWANLIIMAPTIDTIAARELEVYALSFSSVHYNSVGKTLSKFYKQGTFNLDRAIAYIERYLLVPAAKDYKLCCGSMATAWNTYFPKPERLAAAESIAHSFVSEFRLGNFW